MVRYIPGRELHSGPKSARKPYAYPLVHEAAVSRSSLLDDRKIFAGSVFSRVRSPLSLFLLHQIPVSRQHKAIPPVIASR